jgi:hypothetical protein
VTVALVEPWPWPWPSHGRGRDCGRATGGKGGARPWLGGLPKGSQGEWDANGMATICSEVIDRMKRSQGRYMPFPYQAKFGDTMMRETLRMSRSVFMGISSYQRRCLRCHVYDSYEHHELGSFHFVYKRHPKPS